ncbi:MAG: cytochrome c oxidase subunit II [Deltaproteobacteria bacterium]|nr:MAG: cytochrome c oxidase subunit II [Deltaproteobacteria bacterium]TMB33863.1 MAG: cytochrome c oxidase subunit II [Deltaproteobacteria bacterium]
MDEKIYGWWLPPDVSVHGAKIDQLMSVLHWFMALLFIGWGVFFVYCLIRFRARPGHVAMYTPVKGIATKYIEGFVVVVEILLLFGLSTPVWLAYKNNVPDAAKALHIRLVAEQFAWNFQYPGKDGKFGKSDPSLISGDNPLGVDPEDPSGKDDLVTVNQLHIPVNRPVIVAVSSKDVIHSFNIPVLRVKQDTIPGQQIPIWFEATQAGHFELACAQLCGLGHYRMRADVLIDTPEEFAKWAAENAPPPQEEPAAAAPEKK